MSVCIDAVQTSSARLRGLAVLMDVDVDGAELEHRHAHALDLGCYDASLLGALLHISPGEGTPIHALPVSVRAAATRYPKLVEPVGEHHLRRRVSPAARVRMVTLPTNRWRRALHEIGRFAPYSARRLLLGDEPVDFDVLCMEATYWGVGVCVETSAGRREVVHPAPFVPQRYTGASWAFAEQALRATRLLSSRPPSTASSKQAGRSVG